MARPPDPQVRVELVEQAAAMLASKEPLTLRAVAERSGTSTMSVYTHFGGMPGLRRAVRIEGFRRLVAQLEGVVDTDDPVRDLAALGAAYLRHGLTHPHLYRTMFDPDTGLDDDEIAAEGLRRLTKAASRAREAGRFHAEPADVALRQWVAGHGLLDLVIRGVLPTASATAHGAALALGVFLAAGDDPERCRGSVRAGWVSPTEGAHRPAGRA
jgi:AcrR family transcriptional regulator